MVHGVVRSITTQPLLSPPCYNTCGINLVLLTACILTTNLQIAILLNKPQRFFSKAIEGTIEL